MKKIFFIIFFNVLSFVIYPKPFDIAVIPKGSTHEFWKEVEQGAMEAGKEFGVNVTFRGPKYDDDTTSQIKLVETFIKQGIDAIVLAPNNKKDLVPIVKKALNNGIKIIIIDSSLDGDYYDSFIATDNFLAGKMAGEKLAQIIGKKKKAGIIRYYKNNSSTDLREAGFMEAMKEKNIEVTIDVYGGATIGTTYRKGLEILNTNPDVAGFFTPNESSTVGMAKALIETKMAGKYALVGFDRSSEIKEFLTNKIVNGVIIQQPVKMGYLGVKAAIDSLKGIKPEKRVIVDVNYVTK